LKKEDGLMLRQGSKNQEYAVERSMEHEAGTGSLTTFRELKNGVKKDIELRRSYGGKFFFFLNIKPRCRERDDY